MLIVCVLEPLKNLISIICLYAAVSCCAYSRLCVYGVRVFKLSERKYGRDCLLFNNMLLENECVSNAFAFEFGAESKSYNLTQRTVKGL